MATENLLNDGDAFERATWSSMRGHFPHYETFWRINIVPLRSAGSIHFRRGIDEDFEFVAMRHYSLYVNLGKAYKRIFGNELVAGHEFPDDIYGVLQRAAELAEKVVDRFGQLFTKCTGQKPTVDTLKISGLIDRINGYRNLIHQELLAIHIDESGRLFVPRPEKLEDYKKWTDVLYHARTEDFVEVQKQLVDDFCALCSALETAWKDMCELSKQLLGNKVYMERRAQGDSARVVSLIAPPVWVRSAAVSNTTSNAVYSPTAGVIRPRE